MDSVIRTVGEGIEILLSGGGDTAHLVQLEIRRERLDEQIVIHAA